MERTTYKLQDGKIIKGTVFYIFLNHGDHRLVDLKVYADGTLDCLGPLSIEKLQELLKSGRLTRTLPENARLFIPYIGYIYPSATALPTNSDDQFISLLQRSIERLRLNDDIESTCIERFKEYLINPSDLNFTRLRDAYSKLVPGRQALLEQADYKDPLIKLMNGGTPPSREQREYYLNDYFDGEWIEMK